MAKAFYPLVNSRTTRFFTFFDPRFRTFLSPGSERIAGYKPEEGVGQPLTLFYADPDERRKFVQLIMEKGFVNDFEARLIHKDGHIVWVSTSARLYKGRNGEIEGVEGIARDVTDRKKSEEALRESEERFKNLTESTSDWIWEVDSQGVYTYVSPRIRDLLGYNPEEVLEKTPFDFMPDGEDERVRSLFMAALKSQKPLKNLENWNRHKDGRLICVETNGMPFFDSIGSLRGYRGVDRDITERKNAEEQIRTALHEKEVLLREVHHRVKNNLAVINSMVNLQIKYADNRGAELLFDDTRHRIRSMALAHELLYQSDNLAEVDVGRYISKLVNHLRVSICGVTGSISLKQDIEEVSLSMDIIVPLGLIITELVTNCLKHAFSSLKGGEAQISLRSAGENEFELTVADNGVGLPENIDMKNPKSMGFQLVRILTEQLDGSVELGGVRGTEVKVRFKGKRE